MTCKFTSFPTVFQSCQDDGRLIMKGLLNGTPFMVEKISPRAGLEPGTARSVGQRLTHFATGTPNYRVTISRGITERTIW